MQSLMQKRIRKRNSLQRRCIRRHLHNSQVEVLIPVPDMVKGENLVQRVNLKKMLLMQILRKWIRIRSNTQENIGADKSWLLNEITMKYWVLEETQPAK